MQYTRYRNVLQDSAGNGIGSASVTVTHTKTGAAATLYSDAAGLFPILGNVVTTDALGNFGFYVAPGTYNMVFAKSGSTIATDVAVTVTPGRGQAATVTVSSRPSPLGNQDSILTWLNGDMSGSSNIVSHIITGAGTLGTPDGTAGNEYLYTTEAYPNNTYLFNDSGHNQSLNSNVGRTAAVAHWTKVFQAGQGDAVGFHVSAIGISTKAGSTHFLANPAVVCYNGQADAAVDGLYLNPFELILDDRGYDVAGIGLVTNFRRTNATGAKTAVWMGYRAQNQGTAFMDSYLSAVGKWKVGLDFALAGTDFGADQAAISLKSGQRIYFNNNGNALGNLENGWRTTGFEGDYIAHDFAGSFLNFVQGGTSRLQVGATVTANAFFQILLVKCGNYADDAAAAAALVPLGGVYRTGSNLKIRAA